MQKLRGVLHYGNSNSHNSVSRLSSGAISASLTNRAEYDKDITHVLAEVTVGESGGVSLRIEVEGKVSFSEHWPIDTLIDLVNMRK